jgi:hypothetical protein
LPSPRSSNSDRSALVVNNVLCHMYDSMAERCLRYIVRLVGPNGYLFVSGIDLDIRTRVACDVGLDPLQELLDEIHEGDPSTPTCWPFHYAGLEPLNKSKQGWSIRYAAAFTAGLSFERLLGPKRSTRASSVTRTSEQLRSSTRSAMNELLYGAQSSAAPQPEGAFRVRTTGMHPPQA